MSGQTDTTTVSTFSSDQLTKQITDTANKQNTFITNLTTLSDNLNDALGNTCLNTCETSLATNLRTDISNAIDEITTIRNDSATLSRNLVENNRMINSALTQINSNYLLNSEISGKTFNNLTQQNKQLNQEVLNKRRMTEINNYYTNMNTYLNIVMRNLVIILVIIIIFTVLSKKGIIPDNLSKMITTISILGIIGYVIYTVYDINIRDRFNFSEYVIPFDQKAIQLETSGNETGFTDIRSVLGKELTGGINQIQGLTDTCIGDACCSSGTIYDITRGSCILECSGGLKYTETMNPNTGKLEGSCT